MSSGGVLDIGTPTTTAGGTDYSFGNHFSTTVQYNPSVFRWYRHSGSAFPTWLYIYDVDASSTLWSFNATGKTWSDLGGNWWEIDPVAEGSSALPHLDANTAYCITFYLGSAGSTQAHTATSNPITGFSVTGGRWQSGNAAFPSGTTAEVYCFDIDGTAGGPAPPADSTATTYGIVRDELDRWFSADGNLNTHETDLPWLTRQDVATTLANVDNIASGDVATYGLSARSIGAGISGALGLISSALDVATKLHDLLSANGTGGDSYDYHGALEDVRQKVYDLEAAALTTADLDPILNVLRWATGDVLVPANVTSQGTNDLSGPSVWASGYPLHRATVTAYNASQAAIPFAGGPTWLPRIGWWAPIMSDGAVGERKFLEFSDQWLFPCPRGTTGIALFVEPGTDVTLEAYSHP